MTEVEQERLEWVALGIILTLTPTEEGGRQKPLGVPGEPYEPYSYRPNWGLPEMTGTDQAGAMVLSLGYVPFRPGEAGRAVIVPFARGALPQWQKVRPGDHLRTFEGARVVGTATAEWVSCRGQRLTPEDEAKFTAWAGRRGDPPGS